MKKITIKEIAPFLVLVAVAIVAAFIKPGADYVPGAKDPQYNYADIAWVLVSTAMVFLMTPGLAFFYGGMVHRKNVLSTMIKSVVAAGVVGVLWIVCGFSLSFGPSLGGFIGNPTTYAFFKGVNSSPAWPAANTIPLLLFSLFQLMFAVITPGLVVGAVAERIRFRAYILFTVLFSLLVYAPVAHWSWHPDGFLAKMGALDFAGGTVVHINSDSTKRTIKGASIVLQNDSSFNCKTDSLGRFKINISRKYSSLTDSLILFVSHPDYLSQSLSINKNKSVALKIALSEVLVEEHSVPLINIINTPAYFYAKAPEIEKPDTTKNKKWWQKKKK